MSTNQKIHNGTGQQMAQPYVGPTCKGIKAHNMKGYRREAQRDDGLEEPVGASSEHVILDSQEHATMEHVIAESTAPATNPAPKLHSRKSLHKHPHAILARGRSF